MGGLQALYQFKEESLWKILFQQSFNPISYTSSVNVGLSHSIFFPFFAGLNFQILYSKGLSLLILEVFQDFSPIALN